MCGIAGYIGLSGIDHSKIKTCLRGMRHRGPDYASFYHHNSSNGRHVYLLHSRLSIIDLAERSNQPFCIGSKVLVYNGELYNYIELKEELQGQRYTFLTKSDTEVLLRILIEFDWQGLDKCEGMWAFALYDEEEGSLLLSRDRFGEKPLYFHKTSHGFYFGSEIKFIFTLLGSRLEINHQHLYRYMINGYKSLYKNKDTFFVGVEEIPPASVLTIDGNGSYRMRKFWQPNFETDNSLTYDDAVKRVQEAIIRSVQLRLRADVPLAFCMSGGVDSNSLISIAKRVLDYEVHGFTIINEDERYEEQSGVDYVVRELGIRHTSIPITSEGFFDKIRQLILHHDAPVYTISYYLHWLLMSHIAEQGYRISISGTAADELLSGYYDHHNLYLYDIRDTVLLEETLVAWKKYIAPIVRNPFLKNPYLYFDQPNFRSHIYLNNDIFAEYFSQSWIEEFTEVNYTESLLRNRMLNELFHESVPVILHEDDINAMYFSIENRSPFLDRNLFEICCQIPTRYLIRNGYAKVILRDAMHGIVPEGILWNHVKVGFNAPVFSFLDVKDSEIISRILDNGPIFNHVKRNMIAELIKKDYLKNSESKFLCYFLCAKLFIEEFNQA